ncbi:N-acylneuraminate cytidylyltransferase/CMP-N,N'-diacetyllegionaminic acid synthase [Chitinophaga costaii]|uniref:N-acylneuraminate cytidylyltransferase/CMP-N,N'-diacetyllegionaminic acid synthase n=1 Tax=Chitinophaga costaii TaxID=1335309 RepID=A0A1C4F7I1_9BACT|nr:acylneuraminate cytidylyltransferase family protein [Chitinophaga costaii]PUZ21204.1 acylneuraminate cytidylyltransferase family protein [Chitinophaga costaii]SCC51977.1 N-acylneuraminate cytidylyltransferase/CMP-N,N'-diacetyllegionaminic acid synthase [Chitinophaga costaii]
MYILITICARGGSKGIPGKNIRVLAGKKLIGYTIETAQSFAAGKDCVIALSSDANEIIEAAAEYGLHTDYKRPVDLATDSIGKIPVILDVLRYEEASRGKKFDYIIDMDVTSPFRTHVDVSVAFRMLESDPEAINIFSVSPAKRNPYFNMVEQNEDGYFGLAKKGDFVTRQSAPRVYDMNASFYIYKRAFFDGPCTTAITDKSLVYEIPHTCFDLDEPVDFDFMEYLLLNGKLSFML